MSSNNNDNVLSISSQKVMSLSPCPKKILSSVSLQDLQANKQSKEEGKLEIVKQSSFKHPEVKENNNSDENEKEQENLVKMLKQKNSKLKFSLIFYICLSILAICLLFVLPNYFNNEFPSDDLNIPDQQILPAIEYHICLDYNFLQIKNQCSNTFCEVFSSEFASVKEKQKILVDYHKWVLNHQGSALAIDALKSYNSCKEFITISPDGVRIWSLTKRQPISFFTIKDILKYSFAYNYPAIIYTVQSSNINKIHNLTQQEVYNRYSAYMPDQLLITNDDRYIIAYFAQTNSINAQHFCNGTFIQSFTGLEGPVKKISYDTKQGDLIVADSKGIKIYFFHANLPAYKIRTLKEYYQMMDKYYSLLEFEDLIKDSKFFS